MIVIITITSCKKENSENSQPKTASSVLQNKSMEVDFPIIKNPLPIENYFVNKEDTDDEKINIQLHEIGLVARLLFVDTKLNEYIFSKASKNDNSCVDLREMTSNSSLRELVQNKEAFDKLKELVNKADLTQ